MASNFTTKIQYGLKQLKGWVLTQLSLKSSKNLGSSTKIVGTDNAGNIVATTTPTQVLDGLKNAYNNSTNSDKLVGLSKTSNPYPIATTISITDVAKIVRIFNGEDGNTSASDDPYDYGFRFMNSMIDGAISSCWATNLTGSRVLGTNTNGKIQVTGISTDNLDKINYLQNINTNLDVLLAGKSSTDHTHTNYCTLTSSSTDNTQGRVSYMLFNSSYIMMMYYNTTSSYLTNINLLKPDKFYIDAILSVSYSGTESYNRKGRVQVNLSNGSCTLNVMSGGTNTFSPKESALVIAVGHFN